MFSNISWRTSLKQHQWAVMVTTQRDESCFPPAQISESFQMVRNAQVTLLFKVATVHAWHGSLREPWKSPGLAWEGWHGNSDKSRKTEPSFVIGNGPTNLVANLWLESWVDNQTLSLSFPVHWSPNHCDRARQTTSSHLPNPPAALNQGSCQQDHHFALWGLEESHLKPRKHSRKEMYSTWSQTPANSVLPQMETPEEVRQQWQDPWPLAWGWQVEVNSVVAPYSWQMAF